MKSSDLEELLAGVLEIDQATVRKAMRTLKEANMLTSEGPGKKPMMTALDVARCTIAFLVTDRPAWAAEAVRDFGALPSYGDMPELRDPDMSLEALSEWRPGGTFESALDALLRSASVPSEHGRSWVHQRMRDGSRRLREATIEVAPAEAWASIVYAGGRYDFGRPFAPIRDAAPDPVARRWRSGIRQRRSIDQDKIGPLAAAVAEAGA